MDNQQLRAVLLKIQDRLSEFDRQRLHFCLGSHIPRRIQDDSSASGTLMLVESLFDQNKINEQDLTLLINAFDSIQCYHAANLLKDYLETNQSTENLSLLIPSMTDEILLDQAKTQADMIEYSGKRTSKNLINPFPFEYDQLCEQVSDEALKKVMISQSNCLTKFQFIIIDISNRLDRISLAMLTSLNTMIEKCIFIMHDNPVIDFDLLPKKTTFLYTSSQFAATMKRKPKQIEAIFILEDDKNKIDHYERFGSGIDLIFQLSDEIYRCYRKEVRECLESGDLSTAKIKEEFANKIHAELKNVYKSMSREKNNSIISMDTTTTIIWLKLKMHGGSEMEGVRKLLSTFISSFVVFDNQTTCENYLLKNKSTGLVYLIINTDHKISTLQQLPHVTTVYYDEQISSNEYNNLCFRLLSDLAIHYNNLGSIYSTKHDSKIAKDMFMKTHEIYNLLAKL